MPNRLIHSLSPYLLQHAHNPVDWYPWGEEALEKAKNENKPIIVSIGYSACHWCHVMERECFENDTLAQLMNTYFVNIKVDREERPDIDQIYMDAVHLMGLRGGWPLNVFLLPTGEPFYGGTYFPPAQWQSLLSQIARAYENHYDEIAKSAYSFKESLNKSEIEKYFLVEDDSLPKQEIIQKALEKISKQFDPVWGGTQKVPKFPMPCIYDFLLAAGHLFGNEKALKHSLFTLEKIALGGIYDHVGGGFARYSTDEKWFLPHFEKMLYDNGQLLSLYANAYKITKKDFYLNILEETIHFVKRELTDSNGGFYSALDADSEGEEGKFYVFTKEELRKLISEASEFEIFCAYYQITDVGNWEHGKNILWANELPEIFAHKFGIDAEKWHTLTKKWKTVLLEYRNNRIRPGLDDKILTSWNAIMLNGLVDAYRATNNIEWLNLAIANAEFILNHLQYNGKLWHIFKNGQASINGFLEDYAFAIQAFINLYQATFDEKWLLTAHSWTEIVLKDFLDPNEPFLYFTSHHSETLIARKKEVFDNVIPASNSVMAHNLWLMGKLLDKPFYTELVNTMLAYVATQLAEEPAYLSGWGRLLALQTAPFYEVAITGPNYLALKAELDSCYLPNIITAGGSKNSELLLLKNRINDNETKIHVCENYTCQLPVSEVARALEMIL